MRLRCRFIKKVAAGAMSGVTAVALAAGLLGSVQPADGAWAWLTKGTYGPNEQIVIDLGSMDCMQGTLFGCSVCPPPGECDPFTCTNLKSNVYIVPAGSITGNESVVMAEVAVYGPVVITQGSGTSGILGEVIGVTGPNDANGVTNGTYDVVFDQCRNGMFTPGQDEIVATFSVQGVPVDVPGDLNGDGVVDVVDMLWLLEQWGECGEGDCPADLNEDGAVDVSDMLELLTNWG